MRRSCARKARVVRVWLRLQLMRYPFNLISIRCFISLASGQNHRGFKIQYFGPCLNPPPFVLDFPQRCASGLSLSFPA